MYTNKKCYALFAVVLSISGSLFGQEIADSESLLHKYLSKAVSRQKVGYKKSFVKGVATSKEGIAPSFFLAKELANFFAMQSLQLLLPVLAVFGVGLESMWKDAFSKSTPEWIQQLKILLNAKNDLQKSVLSQKVLYLGVPADKIHLKNLVGGKKYVPKAYLLSSNFDDVTNAFTEHHYEVYLMPKDEYLGDLFIALTKYLKMDEKLRNYVSFVAIRPTPGVTKSPYNSKNLPRIIIGFKPSAMRLDVIDVVQKLDNKFKETWDNYATVMGLNVQPRYSQKINNLIYAAYGSADYKDGVGAQAEYANKAKTFLQKWWSGPSDDDMAYKNDAFAIKVKGKYSQEL